MSSWERAKRLLEALLFASSKAVDEGTVERVCGLRGEEIEEAIREINEELAGHPFMIEVLDGKYLMKLKREYELAVSSFFESKLLSKAELRTLAVIAANEPLDISSLVAYRGGASRRHLRKLKSLGLISVSREGRRKGLRTTAKFKSMFSLELGGEMSEPGDGSSRDKA